MNLMSLKWCISLIFIFLLVLYLGLMAYFSVQNPIEVVLEPLNTRQWKSAAKDPLYTKRGQDQFYQRCRKCHGDFGEGTHRASPLDPQRWRSDADYGYLFDIIATGKNVHDNKGWAKKLIKDDIVSIVIFLKHELKVPNGVKK